jgi:subtilisin-like proprotein convertase family protein
VAALVVLAFPASPARATDFNGGPIAIPDSGAGVPYPSTIAVSGVTRAVAKVTVRLRLTHDEPADIDAMIVGPRGQAVMLMSDVGDAPLTTTTTLTFDDAAAGALPDAIADGTFRPTNEDGGSADSFPPPAQAVAPGGALSVFKGTDPNGTWSLYVVDDSPIDSGQISSWTLSLTNAPGSPVAWTSAAYTVPEAAGSVVVTVSRSGSAVPGSIDYATAPVIPVTGGAIAGVDYTAVSGSLAFVAGQTSATLSIPIADDPYDGPDKPFRIRLSNAMGDAALSDPRDAIVTIADDDPPPALTISDLRVPEHSDTGIGQFVISLSAPSERLVTTQIAFAPGTATAGTDYDAYPHGFSIAPGLASVSIAARVHGDKLVERDETFTATLSEVVNATIARAVATATIVDDDKPAPPEISRARVSKRGTLDLTVTSNFDGIALGRVRIGRFGTTSGQVRVVAGRSATVKIALPSATRSALKHHRLTARTAVTISDGSVHKTGRRTFRLHA